MRGVYEGFISITGLNSARTLMYLTSPSTAAIEILEASVTTKGSNVTNQQLECCLQRITTLGTPTGTAITAAKMENGDAASAATCVGNITASEPTYTNNTVIGGEGFSSLGGWRYQPIPEDRMVMPPSSNIGLKLVGSITSCDADVRLVWREIG